MNGMILAAGRGTRLGELGQRAPKILVEVGGEPLLARQLRYLRGGGVEHVVVNVHHLAGQVERYLENHPAAEHVEVVFEPELLGTAGGVRNALARLGAEPFVVLYGDVIVNESIAAVCATHERMEAAATLTVYSTDQLEGKGTVELSKEGLVGAFREKAAGQPAGNAYVNAGLYVVDPDLLRELPMGAFYDFGHDIFPAALARGERLAAHVLGEPVIDVGTPKMLERARATLE